eukprot:augustus_masked-scaffold_9-processed-gene-3.0-mRNA-1 protein AED:0.00 eAED:0.05 QI:0/-1/0/1/-1/1/1/0/1958
MTTETPIYREGDLLFIPNEEDGYVPAKATTQFKQGQPGKVRLTRNDQEVSVSAKESAKIERMDAQSHENIEDMIKLKVMNDASLLYNLRQRYSGAHGKMQIYTSIGSILVSINPYKDLGLYTAEKEEAYLNAGGELSKQPPHVFKVAETAFQMLKQEDKDQSCVITGESGAGKTEATKQFLQYISERSRRNALNSGSGNQDGSMDTSKLRKKILDSNPFLEAFGNAKTLRNDNSSRFGKMLELYFESGHGVIVGAKITNYLLEKSRVTLVQKGERNYHIFYQLCAAATSGNTELKKKYHLASADLFHYAMGQNKALLDVNVDDTPDGEIFKDTVAAMKGLGMTDDDLDSTFRVCSGILHLGNIEIVENIREESEVAPDAKKTSLRLAADMFKIESEELEDAILRHPTKDTFVAHNKSEAEAARDALAKHLYDKLFDHLISKMNAALSMGKSRGASSIRMLGVLDIFGFETFAVNSFEQLCINFCNEKLQAFFNFHVFKKEQEEYEAEGIEAANVGFYDNQGVVDTIGDVGKKKGKGKGQAVMTICDDQSLRGAMASDDALLKAILNQAKGLNDKNIENHYLFKPKIQDVRKLPHLKNAFVVRHFAGDVPYNIEGFLEKNTDTLRENLRMVVGKSNLDLLCKFFPNGGVGVAGKQAKYKKTLGNKFQHSLNRLMDQLNHTTPQFIRTIKPNDRKEPGYFGAAKIYKQLREAGLLEVCKIRKLGYPIRKTHGQFMYDYLCLDKSGKDVADLCAKLEASGKLTYFYKKKKTNPNWQIGKTKVFLRVEQANELEYMRADALKEVLAFIHRFGRKYVFRSRVKQALKAIKLIQEGRKKRDPEVLQNGLDFFLSKGPLYAKLPVVLEGLEIMKDLRVQLEVIQALQEAIENDNMTAIKVKLEVAYGLGMSNHAVVKDAERKLELFETEREVKQKLESAIGAQEVGQLKSAVDFATENGFSTLKECKLAERLLETLQTRENLLDKLKTLLKSDNLKSEEGLEELAELVQALRDNGCPDDHYLITEAVKVGDVILQQNKQKEDRIRKLVKNLNKAIKKRDLKKLKDLVDAAIQLRYTGPLISQATELIKALGQRQELLDEVAKAARVLREKSKMPAGITEEDLKPLRHAIKTATSGTELDLSQEIQVKEGEELIKQMLEQLKVQEDITKALDKATPASYYKVLEKVQRLGLQTREADEICQKVRELEMLKAKAEAITNDQLAEQLIIDLQVPSPEDRKKHLQRRLDCMLQADFQKKAKEAGKSRDLSMTNYYKVRSDADFVSREPGYAKHAKLQLKHAYMPDEPLSKSMLEMDDLQEHKAVQINQTLLRFCDGLSGNKKEQMEAAMSFIVVHGISDEVLADEIYIQLAKHLTANPNALSKNKGWYLLCLCATYFGVTERFLPYVLHFLSNSVSDAGLEGNYAKYALAQLSASQQIDPREVGFKPSSAEIKAFFQRPPVLAQLELLDRSYSEIPIPPDYTLRDAAPLIRSKTKIMIELKNPEYSVYIKATSRPPKLSYKARLENFYRLYKPENLANVDNILEYYKGHEEALFAELVDVPDYGPEPTPVVVGPQKRKKKNGSSKGSGSKGSKGDADTFDDFEEETGKSQFSSFSMSSKFSSISVSSAFSAISTFSKRLFKRARGLSTVDIKDLDAPSPRIPWPVPWYVHLGHVMNSLFEQDRIPVLTYKRRILKTRGKPDENLYLQLSRDFLDGLLVPYTQGETALLSVLMLAIRLRKMKKQVPYGDRDRLVKAGLKKCIPKTLRREHKKDPDWLDSYINVAVQKSNELRGRDQVKDLQQKFFEECIHLPTYGMSFFFGQILKGNVKSYYAKNQTDMDEGAVKIGMSSREVAFFFNGKKQRSFPIEDVLKYSTDGTTFTMKVRKQKSKGGGAEEDDFNLRAHNKYMEQRNNNPLEQRKKTQKFKSLRKMVTKVTAFVTKQTDTIQIYTLQPMEMYDLLFWLKKHAKKT